MGGVMTYDSTMQIGEDVKQDNNSGLSYITYDKYLRGVDGAVRSGFAAPVASFNTYLDGRKVELSANYTDAAYFEILDLDFIAGMPYNAPQVTAGERVVVLSDHAARDYFGHARAELIGQELPIGEKDYRIIGIVSGRGRVPQAWQPTCSCRSRRRGRSTSTLNLTWAGAWPSSSRIAPSAGTESKPV